MTLEERAKQLQKMNPEVEKLIMDAAQKATMEAIKKAKEMTPPTQDDLQGTYTLGGEMKQHWATDSDPNPKRSGNAVTTLLANNMQYASYVNDGHRMDRHFVPGLYINQEAGMLEYDPSKDVGIMVGTKTSYVPGLYMADAAKKVYQETVKTELDKIQEVFK